MLGKVVRDPDGIEGSEREAEGLGLLDIETTLVTEKTVVNQKIIWISSGTLRTTST